MEIYQILITAGGGVGAAVTIWKVIIPVYHWLKSRATATTQLSQQIEQGFTKMSGEIADLDTKISLNRRDILKSEILWLLKHEPTRVETIENKFKEYRDHGGNSYICEMMEIWRAEFAPVALKEKMWGKK